MWIQLTEDEAVAILEALSEAGAANHGSSNPDRPLDFYDKLADSIMRQSEHQNPFKLIRWICEENDWEEGSSDGNRIWSIADAHLMDPDTVDAP